MDNVEIEKTKQKQAHNWNKQDNEKVSEQITNLHVRRDFIFLLLVKLIITNQHFETAKIPISNNIVINLAVMISQVKCWCKTLKSKFHKILQTRYFSL